MSIFPLLTVVSTGFISDFAYIFAIAMASLIFTVTLRSATLFLALLAAIIILNTSSIPALFIAIAILQLLLTIYLIYKLKLAVDWNYHVIEEKTHLRKRDITKGGYTGVRKSFS
ncbi:hypothetical protein [Virgibacillus sp. YIM 98842]|uniref:hypothetical protein n=1 Tax=Virgibacillus sp. YIM 98842 TaxID=2663533 RepID=UPI0013DA0297|nr:hypothetical protein [Virgibacillus sp. YIM 98842]